MAFSKNRPAVIIVHYCFVFALMPKFEILNLIIAGFEYKRLTKLILFIT